MAVLVMPGLTPSFGQDKLPKEVMAQYKTEVEQMVSYLRFTLNILGDPSVSAKEKDVVINESYLKLFRDAKVQVEDDLVKNRDVVTNKDVQAYLKDVDFFFKKVQFDFNITDISHDVNPAGKLYFTIKLMCSLKGITIDEDSINTNMERYIEVNVDEDNKDLRIASIYTTRLSRNQELTFWWASLSDEWKALLGLGIEVKPGLGLSEIDEFSDSTYVADGLVREDSINIIDHVKKAASRQEINLAGSTLITDLQPLDQLKNLRKLDISSSDITDLFPIRNLTTLQYLDCSNTMVEDLQPLRYCKSLKKLFIDNTPVTDISVVNNFDKLEVLHLAHTVIDSLPALEVLLHLKDLDCSSTNLAQIGLLSGMKTLEELNISNTSIEDVAALAPLVNLKNLNLSQTKTKNINALEGLAKLETLNIERTEVDDLSPLVGLNHLVSVFADGSALSMEGFVAFASARPEVNVIFMTEALAGFWNGLSSDWKAVLQPKVSLPDSLESIALHRILHIEEVDISKQSYIDELSPLQYMPLLKTVDFSGTAISDITPIAHLSKLERLKGSHTKVIDLAAARGLISLRTIDFSHTGVSDISPLVALKNLDTLIFDFSKVKFLVALDLMEHFKVAYFDSTYVTDDDVYNLKFDIDHAVVVYKSERLRSWWGNMDDAWQDVFKQQHGLDARPSREQLHMVAGVKQLKVSGTSIKNLNPISEMVRLESLAFTDTRISSLAPLANLKNLKVLLAAGNPISDVEPLAGLVTLEILDLDNTQIDDLDPLQSLARLRELKFSGTNVRDISPIEGLTNLEVLEFAKPGYARSTTSPD